MHWSRCASASAKASRQCSNGCIRTADVSIAIEHVSAPTSEARELLSELDRILGAAYEPDQRHALSIEELFQPDVCFFIARLQGGAAGCGGVAFYNGYAEVKRMYAREQARGRGVGKALLARIEAEARNAGERVLRLETGIHQAAAIGLYERWGFRACGPFGRYAELPPRRIVTSLFYEKPL
ncbi:MAG: GNAT family N-acetyltransferase [Alphaproteobacteria bacterium]|nr:GNAT family N-acetyltransferase [Alphaproteobacteria bacterium]